MTSVHVMANIPPMETYKMKITVLMVTASL